MTLQLQPAVVYLGLGSNLGDRARHLREALAALRALLDIEAVSRVYESEPVGYRNQSDFWNLVLRARTRRDPLELFGQIKQIEQALGRTETFRNAPRIIDIDLLSYNDIVLQTEVLELPHPRMHERTFVLYPLAELEPEFRHPALKQSVHDLIAALPSPTRAVPLAEGVLEERA